MKDRLLSALRLALQEAGLWRRDASLLAAVSGGSDSVCLLWLLCLAREEIGFRVSACHVQHGLRGESSQGDEAFVRQLCENLGVPLAVKKANLSVTLADPGVETAARNRRRQLFLECMEETAAHGLLTGHHRDDQAETVLMRLLRGAGVHGLCGIRPAAPFGRGVVLRPLLAFGRDEVQSAAAEAGLGWRHDETNDVADNPRNALRLDVLPSLEALFPGGGRHIAQAAGCLREDDDCLTALSDALYSDALLRFPGVHGLGIAPLAAAPAALVRRAMRRFYREGLSLAGLAPAERELSRADTVALGDLLGAAPGSTVNLPCGLSALRGQRCLHLTFQGGKALLPPPASPAAALPAGSGCVRFAGLTFAFSRAVNAAKPIAPGETHVCLPPALTDRCLLRFPLPGDIIHPLGAPGEKPLRRFLTDRKLDPPFRAALPLLALDHRVLWIPGLATGEELRRRETDEPRPSLTLLTKNLPY